MKQLKYRLKAAWFLLCCDSFILSARRGNEVMQGMDCESTDIIVKSTFKMVAPMVVNAVIANAFLDEAGQAVDKLKNELNIP